MIVDPDFLDHWRTGMVIDALNDPAAPMCILRLWAHCQERKSDTFSMPSRGLKAQCKFPGNAQAFESALIEAGFLKRDGDVITVLGWAEKNASLLAAWENGAKGGRPKKNQTETHGKPMGNPSVAHGQPIANPDETDKRREEKRREEQPKDRERSPVGSRLSADWVCPEEWLAYCRSERPELDASVVACNFADYWHGKAGAGARKADWLATWRSWVRKEDAPKPQGRPPPESFRERDLRLASERVAAFTGRRPADNRDTIEIEATDVTPIRLGR